jgi:hypothetical protein
MRFFRFDFGAIAAISGDLGMIWNSANGWEPAGGSKELAHAVVSDEGSEEIQEAEIDNLLLVRRAPKPNFLISPNSTKSHELIFKSSDAALEYIEKIFTFKKLTNKSQAFGIIRTVIKNELNEEYQYIIEVSALTGFIRTKIKRVTVAGIRHPELTTSLKENDLVTWGPLNLKMKIPAGYILDVWSTTLDTKEGQFIRKKDVPMQQESKKLTKEEWDKSVKLADTMWRYETDHKYGSYLPSCEFLVDQNKHYISYQSNKGVITAYWDTENDCWTSGIDRRILEGLSFSSPRMFEQVVFSGEEETVYFKKQALNEFLSGGITLGKEKIVQAEETWRADKLPKRVLELRFSDKEWNELLLGNTSELSKFARHIDALDEPENYIEYKISSSQSYVTINYMHSDYEGKDRFCFEGNLKELKRYYS